LLINWKFDDDMMMFSKPGVKKTKPFVTPKTMTHSKTLTNRTPASSEAAHLSEQSKRAAGGTAGGSTFC
jgi:hypothetical protein